MNSDSPDDLYHLLERNGWTSPSPAWVDYARRKHFKDVASVPRTECPSCGTQASDARKIGSYVFYSTLFTVRECQDCGLIFVDRLLDGEVIRGHFERAYKDEEYFTTQRAAIFRQIADLVGDLALPEGATILDLGGAKGHLLAAIRDAHPRNRYVLSDLSEAACEHAARVYSLEAYCTARDSLESLHGKVDVLLLIDVLYYVPDLQQFLAEVGALLRPGGTVIVRVPHKLLMVRVAGLANNLLGSLDEVRFRSKLQFLNPEHLYIFSRRYLARRFGTDGFAQIRFLPAAPLLKGSMKSVAAAVWRMSRAVPILRDRVLLAPSMIMTAKKAPPRD